MKIRSFFQDHTSNGGIAAKQASTKQTSLILGIDSEDTQLVLKTFHRRRDKQRLESNVEPMRLFPMTTQVDSSG